MRTKRLLVLIVVLGAFSPVAADVGTNSVGMNIHIGPPGFIDACVDLGVGWVRVDGNWFALEPAMDDYQWGWMDETVDRAVAAGLKVFMTLGYTPAWVERHGDTDGSPANDCPNNSSDWADFVDDAVTHFRARGVTHFGLWNEPNLSQFFQGNADEYAQIIAIPGAVAVHSACNDCKVLGPELANVGDCDDFLERVLQLSGTGTFDIITHHLYQDFAETGWQIWDGDSFINALDDQRFPFTRRDLRQILDGAGWTGEVWITETGYRAIPIGDNGEENLQAVYVRRVLEEQLKRAWYTNSFFYEICDCGVDQPDCDIDGFGVMRPTAGEFWSRTFPRDYRLKPAFLELRQFIADHPEITGLEPPSQCGDGADNDGDGMIDLEDRGCGSATDDDESDDPPRKRLEAFCTPGVTLDGDFADFGGAGWISLSADDWKGAEPLGAGDLSVRAAARWSVQGLFLAVEVIDDIHDNSHPPADLWQGDSVQLAFDTGRNGGRDYDNIDDHEINFALVNGAPTTYRYHGPAEASDDFYLTATRQGSVTRYEIWLAPSALPGISLSAGTLSGFSFLVNDADGSGRIGWMEWTTGIGMQKAPEYFGEILLSASCSGGQTNDGGDGGGPDANGDADAGQDDGSDAGRDGGESDGGADLGSDGNQETDTGTDAGDDVALPSGGGCNCASTLGLGTAMVFWLSPIYLYLRRRMA